METEIINSFKTNFTYDVEEKTWSAKKKIGRQIAEISFTCYQDDYSIYYWWTSFVIYTKRKKVPQHFGNSEITGESGLEPILFAKDALLEFEELLKEEYNFKKDSHVICVAGSDRLRNKIYRHFLPRYGYKRGKVFNENIMLKKI